MLFLAGSRLLAQISDWELQDSVYQMSYMSLDCADSLHCMAISTFGFGEFDIRKSTDGGRTWRTVYLDSGGIGWPHPLPAPLRHISYPSADICAVGGDKGQVLVTRDGGATWSRQIFGDLNVKTVVMSNANVGMFAIGADSIFVTTDGGRTWGESEMPSMPRAYGVVDITAPAPGTFLVLCVVMSDSSYLFRTDDTGRTWRQMPSRYRAQNIYFIDSLHGWMASRIRVDPNGELSRLDLAYTRDGGEQWEQLIDSDLNGKFWKIHSMAFKDTLNGIIGDYSFAVWLTSDGGRTWYRDWSVYALKLTTFSGVEYLTPTRLISATADGKIYAFESQPESGVTEIGTSRTGLSLSPNPVDRDGMAMIRLSTERGGRLDVVVTDLLGREVATEQEEVIGPGERTLPLAPRGRLSAGTYIVRIALDGDMIGVVKAFVR